MTQHSSLRLKNGGHLAYHCLEGASPGIIFLGGFRSDMTGEKAVALHEFCKKRGQAFVRFDYQGHGQSSGTFEEGTISTWKEDALTILTKLTKGPQILVGSSMGGWISLLLALEKPRRIAGIIGIAAAPDFTEYLIYDALTDAQKKTLIEDGKLMVPYIGAPEEGDAYPITRALIEDGRNHLLLHHPEIPIYCPVRLLHGTQDDDVPWEISFSLNEKLATRDIKTHLFEGSNHRLSTPQDIAKILRVLEKMLGGIKN